MADNVRQFPVVAENPWTQDKIDLIKRQICPSGITNDELSMFIEQCKRSGLDPLLKQAFCVPRRKKIVDANNVERWITVHEFQPAEAGMLARAARFPDFAGVMAGAVFTKDECKINAGDGTVHHVYSPIGDRGELVGAWARLLRHGKAPIVVWLKLGAYVQTTSKGDPFGRWLTDPAIMMEKCARVATLRKAYPEDFGGLYIPEEMPLEEGGGVIVDAAPAKPTTAPVATMTEAVKGKLTAKLGEPLAAKTSRLPIQDESTTPDRPALPPPSLATIDAKRPYDLLEEIAAQQATTARELIERAKLVRRTKGDVTQADLATIRELLAKAEPKPEDLIE